jgi:hydroxymethylbilane synthase
VRLSLMSRASALARLQAALVERALRAAHPGLEVTCLTRSSAGDQDQTSPLWKLPDKGAFTADLSAALVDGEASLAVHSYKDLPTEMPGGTRIAGALPRADARDLLLMRADAVAASPSHLRILSSSPRRAWLLETSLPPLVPWRVNTVEATPVRGNIETRLRKLVEGDAHGLVIAKAAIDRLLGFGPPFEQEAALIRERLAGLRWMVLPMREFPWAPAQGAIAIEVPAGRDELIRLITPILCTRTAAAVEYERHVLEQHGGGCHQALGAAVLDRSYGRVVSIRGRDRSDEWTLDGRGASFPRAPADRIWPRTTETILAARHRLAVAQPAADALRVARAEALPESWSVPCNVLVWAAGGTTWRKLAARGVWVNGCADGLGDDEAPNVDLLAGRPVSWLDLTHDHAPRPNALATYHVDVPLPDDLGRRSHFFWTSGELFRQAIDRWPAIRDGWHASGPGRTRQTIAAMVAPERTGVWLDRESWERDICL